MKGLFVVLEGSDGAGKSTFRVNMEEKLKQERIPYLCTREPGGSILGEKIRALLLDPENTMCGETEALLYAASRAEHVAKTIKPALEEGKLVLCERFLISSLAYQGYGRNLGVENVETINAMAIKDVHPDLTLFFHIPPKESLKRKTEEKDRLEQESMDFHQRVALGYEELIEKKTLCLIDATESSERVYQKAEKIILEAWRRCQK